MWTSQQSSGLNDFLMTLNRWRLLLFLCQLWKDLFDWKISFMKVTSIISETNIQSMKQAYFKSKYCFLLNFQGKYVR